MPSTKVSLSQMVDLALGTPEVGSVNFNVLHSLLHAMLKRLNIIDVQTDINDFDRDFLSAAKARELSLLSDVDSGRGDDTEDTISERSSMPTPSTGRKTPYHNLEVKVAKLQEQLENITAVPSNRDLFDKAKNQYEEKPIGEMWFNMQLMSRVETNEKGIAKVNYNVNYETLLILKQVLPSILLLKVIISFLRSQDPNLTSTFK